MPTPTSRTLAATEIMPAEMPDRTVVAGPVSACWAIDFTGLKSELVQISATLPMA